ncbi:hypothetical protein DL98DRAFT_579967 [Cadophora sp. DSE1049]|nr:hypothetical protein DL98DRAFT_579967 [Cadophora sp. DSE1049]
MPPLTPEEEEARVEAAHTWAFAHASPLFKTVEMLTACSVAIQLPLLLYTPSRPESIGLFLLLYVPVVKGTAWWCFIMSYIYMAETIDENRWCSWEQRLGYRFFAREPVSSADKVGVANKITFYRWGDAAVFMASGILWKGLLLWLLRHGMMYPENRLTVYSCFAVLYDLVFVPCAFLASLVALIAGGMNLLTVGIALGECECLTFVDEELWPDICAYPTLPR